MTNRIARFGTILLLIGPCVFAAVQGRHLTAFAAARDAAGADKEAAMRRWFDTPTVAVDAFDTALRGLAGVSGPETARRRAALLTQSLSLRPLSAVTWLSLAGMRLADGDPLADVLAALNMSSVTGPNEAGVMWQRGVFALLQWDWLPPDFRQRAITDLAGPLAAQILFDGDAALASSVLAGKTPEARNEIAAMLQAQGVTADTLRRIGLSAP